MNSIPNLVQGQLNQIWYQPIAIAYKAQFGYIISVPNLVHYTYTKFGAHFVIPLIFMILIRILRPGPGPKFEKYLILKASVLKIQTYWRRFKSQKIFKQQRNAVTLLQRQVRRFVSKRKYQRSKAAIVKVQNIYRSKLARREYLKKKLAIVKLQTSNCEEREEQIP